MKHLLLVYHSKTGNTQAMAEAIAQGARDEDVAGVELRFLHAGDAGPDDLLWADALLIGSPENFGYLSGMVKDFLDRTFYEVEGKLSPLPYAAFISAGNDGTGAIRALERIANGYPFVKVQDPLISRGEITQEDLDACRELGLTLAAGLEVGLY
ncbi:MAG: NAD(P)H-dependent oxidoreductase [Pseudomonadaceae bacterium]|nr:NAD(P)H-dependent oxidoreductase [Pseudomonadaceae bacterium]